jgi:hypothetical protein
MQALQLVALSGWQWVGSGWKLFRRQPFSFATMLLLCCLALLGADALVAWMAQALGTLPFVSATLVNLLGGVLVAVLSPVLTIGFLQGCRVARSGLPVHPVLIFAGFRSGRETLSRLLVLGAIQTVSLVFILLVVSGPDAFRVDAAPDAATASAPPNAASTRADAGKPKPDVKADATPPAPMTEAEQQEAIRNTVVQLERAVIYLPIAMVMWYAPMLVAWHGLPVGKALFFSLVAVWRNRAAFTIYGLGWLMVWFVLSIVMAIVAVALNLMNVVVVVAAPLAMLLVTWMYCSVYATYETVFVDPASPAPVTPVADPLQ